MRKVFVLRVINNGKAFKMQTCKTWSDAMRKQNAIKRKLEENSFELMGQIEFIIKTDGNRKRVMNFNSSLRKQRISVTIEEI